jgi:hypothetical protein
MGFAMAGAKAFTVGPFEHEGLAPFCKFFEEHLRTCSLTRPKPFLAGIFSGTLFWVGFRWLTTVMPCQSLLATDMPPLISAGTLRTNFFLNILFGALYGFTGYFYIFTMAADPGFVPKSASRSASKSVIDELMEAKLFDENHFCVNCMVRKPLRSKHCKRCERCVAKTDQYVCHGITENPS